MHNKEPQRQVSREALARIVLLLLLVFPLAVYGQSGGPKSPRFDLGGQVLGLKLDAMHEGPAGIGGRFGLRISPRLRLDTEVDYFPQNPAGNFGQSLALVGLRIPLQLEGSVFSLRARSGLIHFGGRFFQDRNTSDTFPVIDLGVGFEMPRSRHWSFRVEAGDLVVLFNGARIVQGSGPVVMHTEHNLLVGAGLTFRF